MLDNACESSSCNVLFLVPGSAVRYTQGTVSKSATSTVGNEGKSLTSLAVYLCKKTLKGVAEILSSAARRLLPSMVETSVGLKADYHGRDPYLFIE